jgi:hypothetical protein
VKYVIPLIMMFPCAAMAQPAPKLPAIVSVPTDVLTKVYSALQGQVNEKCGPQIEAMQGLEKAAKSAQNEATGPSAPPAPPTPAPHMAGPDGHPGPATEPHKP